MRILMLSNLYPPHYVGGYELICEQVNRAMNARGHQTLVLTSNHQVQGSATRPDETGVDRSLRIHGFFGHPWLRIHKLRELEFHNNETLRRCVGEFRPDIIHVFNLGGLSKSLTLTLQRLGVPFVYFVSDHWVARSLVADVWLDWWNRPKPNGAVRLIRAALEACGFRRAWDAIAPTGPIAKIRFPRVYFCSRFLRELTLDSGYDVRHGQVIHNAVDTSRFSGEIAPATRPLTKLLYVGRLAEDKGVMTALKAMAAVQGRFAGELHVYGKGDPAYVEQLTAFVKDHRLPVLFHTAAAAEMPAVYRSHDALLFTSEWGEPFALTPLEAMASGLPVIGTLTGGSAELFHPGENALTYEAGNPAELASRILELDAHPDRRVAIATQGQTDVRTRHAEPVIMDEVERYLLESLEQTPA